MLNMRCLGPACSPTLPCSEGHLGAVRAVEVAARGEDFICQPLVWPACQAALELRKERHALAAQGYAISERPQSSAARKRRFRLEAQYGACVVAGHRERQIRGAVADTTAATTITIANLLSSHPQLIPVDGIIHFVPGRGSRKGRTTGRPAHAPNVAQLPTPQGGRGHRHDSGK